MKKFKIDRRTFLRSTTSGISTVVGLPLLECMFSSSEAYADAPGQYSRFFCFYVPNGIIEEKWFPESGSKTDFDLRGTALQAFQDEDLKSEISLYRGMDNCCGTKHENSSGNRHLVGIASFLTGKGIPKQSDRRHVSSLDQELADALPRTKVHSMQLAGNSELDKPNHDRYYNAMKNGLSWNKDGALLPLKSELRTEFDRLYSGGGGSVPGGIDRRAALQLSVLDEIKQDRQRFMRNISAADASRLDEYFESLRDLELSLEAETSGPATNCSKPNFGDVPNPQNGSRTNSMGDHARIAAKIVANAFACGLTHSVTYAAGGEAAGCQYQDIGVNTHFHNSVSHNRNGRYDDWVKIDRLHGDLAANFMKEFRNTSHGTGNLLDGTAILFGSGLGNGDRHEHTDIALMVGGRFGNWQHGRFHKFNGRSHADLIDTIRDQMGLGKRYGHNSVPIS